MEQIKSGIGLILGSVLEICKVMFFEYGKWYEMSKASVHFPRT